MAKQIDHDAGSAVSTVGLETGKGFLGGILTAGAIGAAVLALPALAVFGLGATATVAAVAGFAGGAYVAGPLGAVAGTAIGAIKGVAKVRDENAEFLAAAKSVSIEPVVQQAQQNAYMAGVQDGQLHVIQKLQEAQAIQQASFAERHAKKGTFTPEAIIAQREAAANQPIEKH